MIYLMLYNRACGHVYYFNYQHRIIPRDGSQLCNCPPFCGVASTLVAACRLGRE